jgi:hypothetical protein
MINQAHWLIVLLEKKKSMTLVAINRDTAIRGRQVVYMPPHAAMAQIISHADNEYGIITGQATQGGWVPVRFLILDKDTKRWKGKYGATDTLVTMGNLYNWQSIPNSEVDIILQEIGV